MFKVVLSELASSQINSLFLLNNRRRRRVINFLEEEHDTKRRKIVRIDDYIGSVVLKINDVDFTAHFRLSRASVQMLAEDVGPVLSHNELGRPGIEFRKKILMSLWFFANTETYRQIADRFDVSSSSVCRVIFEFMMAVEQISHKHIRWPRTNAEIERTLRDFETLRDVTIPNVFGAIDGTHIKILAPASDKASFINRKQVASIILQGVCDANYSFTNVFAGWPGSSNDARVFRCSILGQAMLSEESIMPEEACLLGDGAYPLLKNLMVPYKDNGRLTTCQIKFNQTIGSQRVTIEQSFGKLFTGFRRLRFLDFLKLKKCGKAVTVACCLHNICQRNGDYVEATSSEVEDYLKKLSYTNKRKTTKDGIARREQVSQYLQNL